MGDFFGNCVVNFGYWYNGVVDLFGVIVVVVFGVCGFDWFRWW